MRRSRTLAGGEQGDTLRLVAAHTAGGRPETVRWSVEGERLWRTSVPALHLPPCMVISSRSEIQTMR